MEESLILRPSKDATIVIASKDTALKAEEVVFAKLLARLTLYNKNDDKELAEQSKKVHGLRPIFPFRAYDAHCFKGLSQFPCGLLQSCSQHLAELYARKETVTKGFFTNTAVRQLQCGDIVQILVSHGWAYKSDETFYSIEMDKAFSLKSTLDTTPCTDLIEGESSRRYMSYAMYTRFANEYASILLGDSELRFKWDMDPVLFLSRMRLTTPSTTSA